MEKRIYLVLCIMMLFLLNACGKDINEKDMDTMSQRQYREVPTVFRYEEEYCPLRLVGMNDNYYYFYQRTDWVENEKAYWCLTFYRQALSKDVPPESLHITLNNSFLSSTYISEDGMLYLALTQEEDKQKIYQIVGYGEVGEQIVNITLPERELSGETILDFLVMNDGKICVLTTKTIFILDNKGGLIESYKCIGSSFQTILKINENSIAATYFSKETNKYYFAILNNNGMSQSIEISGNGTLLCSDSEMVYFVDAHNVYSLDVKTNQITKQMSLEGRNINLEQIVGVRKISDGFAFLGYGFEQDSVRYVEYIMSDKLLEQSEKYDSGGKRYVYLYDYTFSDINHIMLERIVEAYNEQSTSYRVELRDYGYARTHADDFDPLKIMVSNEFPDMIFSDNNSLINFFVENDCIEDLSKYIHNSKNISLSEIVEPVKNVYCVDGSVYAIPRMFSLTSIIGKESQMGDPGWTVDEFLQWMIEHPNLQARMNLTQSGVLDICIDTLIESCIDEENGKIDLEGQTFKSFLEGMKRLNLDEVVSKPSFETLESGLGYIAEANIETFQRTAYEDYVLGEESVYKGYPSVDGKPKAYLHAYTLSLFTTSQVKEGAYEFIEFFLMYQGDEFGDNNEDHSSRLYSLESNLNKSIEKALQENEVYEFSVTQGQIDKILELFPYAVERKNKYLEIREIIEEEIPAYLEGQKDLNSVCKIIQSRVQLFLDET